MIPDWMHDSLCQHFSTPPWLADPGNRSHTVEVAMGVVCLACPVRAACDQYAVHPTITSGFWAGRDRSAPAGLQDSNEVA